MTWEDVFRLILAALASVGGAGAIILGLSTWLGKMWAASIIESLRQEDRIELENIKYRLDLLKTTSLRYSKEQLTLYNKLWNLLCDLKFAADILWDLAINSNLRIFTKKLKVALEEVEKSYLFINDSHYRELLKLLNIFKNFEINKKNLIQLYEMKRQPESEVNHNDIINFVTTNRQTKLKYENIMKAIGDNLRKQLKGEND